MNIAYFKKALEDEQIKLEEELKTIAHRNPKMKSDWEVSFPDLNVGTAEKGDAADQEEEYENRTTVEFDLEDRLREVISALERIKNGEFGNCEEDGEQISEERLRANPAARTCVAHAK